MEQQNLLTTYWYIPLHSPNRQDTGIKTHSPPPKFKGASNKDIYQKKQLEHTPIIYTRTTY